MLPGLNLVPGGIVIEEENGVWVARDVDHVLFWSLIEVLGLDVDVVETHHGMMAILIPCRAQARSSAF